jgi:hypothetical protein
MTSERTGRPTARRSRRRKNIEFVEHLSGQEQMLLTFPWSRNLTPSEREEFAAALAHHPSSFSNAQLEALILSWKHRAERAQRERSAA